MSYAKSVTAATVTRHFRIDVCVKHERNGPTIKVVNLASLFEGQKKNLLCCNDLRIRHGEMSRQSNWRMLRSCADFVLQSRTTQLQPSKISNTSETMDLELDIDKEARRGHCDQRESIPVESCNIS